MILTIKSLFPSLNSKCYYYNVQIPDSATVRDLYMISCAELGLSTNSPICLKRNGVVLDKSDIQTIRAIGISPYDTIDVTILTRGSSMNHLPPDSREQTCESSKQVKRSMENTVQDSKRRKRCLVDIVKGIEQYFRDSTSIHY